MKKNLVENIQKKINKKKRQKEIQDIKKVVLTKYSFV